ncbi:hypothetical protein ASG43_18040 [Aureimonas sp. Leaf454]|nr:hypothetical protein ASG43_18040 [Aureimonas sp. Leaf454]
MPETVPGGAGAPLGRSRLDPIALPELPDRSTPRLDLPVLPAYAPQNLPSLDLLKRRKTLVLDAKLVEDGEIVPNGLVWRLFSPYVGVDGKLPLVASAMGGSATFEVPMGTYLLHVGFGSAGATKRIDYTGEQTRETVVLQAGGLKLSAVAATDVPIPEDKLTFDIFTEAADERNRQLVVDDVPPHRLVRLSAGNYHVVSNFGSVNATVRADLKVEAGKITEATLQHAAAELTMKLVREKGGEAIADTAWSIANASGDVVRESVGAFPSMVLAEGDYLIIARNKDRTFQRAFHVAAGVNTDVEVLTSDIQPVSPSQEGSGD